MRRSIVAATLAAAGAGALALALSGRGGLASILAGLVFLLLAATMLAPARRLVTPLRELVGKRVVVTAWGAPVTTETAELIFTSVSSFGAGLLIRLQRGQKLELLKVAQPQHANCEKGRLVVPEAAYVQWAGSASLGTLGNTLLSRPPPNELRGGRKRPPNSSLQRTSYLGLGCIVSGQMAGSAGSLSAVARRR